MHLCRTLAIVMSCLGWVASPTAFGEVRPHALISDGMVLQRGMKVPIWGTADDGEQVTVQFQGQEIVTTARDGKWSVNLENLKAGGPFPMKIKGKKAIEFKNVLVGDVWVASGQSNMEWPVRLSDKPEQAIASSKNPMIRLFAVAKRPASAPISSGKLAGMWPGEREKLLGRRLLFRQGPAKYLEGSYRTHPHLVGRHTGRGVDQFRRAGSGVQPEIPRRWAGAIARGVSACD